MILPYKRGEQHAMACSLAAAAAVVVVVVAVMAVLRCWGGAAVGVEAYQVALRGEGAERKRFIFWMPMKRGRRRRRSLRGQVHASIVRPIRSLWVHASS